MNAAGRPPYNGVDEQGMSHAVAPENQLLEPTRYNSPLSNTFGHSHSCPFGAPKRMKMLSSWQHSHNALSGFALRLCAFA